MYVMIVAKIFKVSYHSHQLCKDGGWRRTFWYRCRTKGVEPGSAAHERGHKAAEAAEWRHVEAVAKLGGEVLCLRQCECLAAARAKRGLLERPAASRRRAVLL